MVNTAAYRADTTETMAKFRESMAVVAAENDAVSLRSSHGGLIRRLPDPSLLEFDRLKALMLPFCTDPWATSTRRLAKLSIMFMQTPHYARAVELGWNAVDFFGVSSNDVRDAKPRGLLPTLAWSRFNGKIRGVDHEGVKVAIVRKDGVTTALQMWRPHPCPGTVPFWESTGLENGA